MMNNDKLIMAFYGIYGIIGINCLWYSDNYGIRSYNSSNDKMGYSCKQTKTEYYHYGIIS